MSNRLRISSPMVRKLCSVLLCGLVAASCAQDADAGEAHGRRMYGFRNGPTEARNARIQQRMQQRAVQREENVRRPPEVAPVAPPAYQPPEPVPRERASQPGRMTIDERRALRQQINEAGRDVYRPNRP